MRIPWSPRRRAADTDERGSALVGVLLLLMMMSALAAALGISGQTETLIARNQRSSAQAHAAAEAGLNHAVELATTYIFEYKANGFADVGAAIDALLKGPDGAIGSVDTDADNQSLGARTGIDAAEAIPLGTRLTIVGGINAEYEALIMDDAGTALGEEVVDDPYNDTNDRLIIRATGYAGDGATVTLEALLSPVPLPAVVTDGDLEISGNPTITGVGGSVHSNADLAISGNPEITGDATASGTYSASGNPDIGGAATGGADEVPVMEVHASQYLSEADFILQSTGHLTLPDGSVVCDASSDNGACQATWGWEFKGTGNGWAISGNTAADGTFYVEGPVKVSGNAGSSADPVQITIIAEGSIEISGNPDFAPDAEDLMFVTDGDLKISGGIDIPLNAQGQILVHEQIMISGNPSLSGQIIVENATSVDTLVEGNLISGNPTISYDGTFVSSVFAVSGWRDVRDDD